MEAPKSLGNQLQNATPVGDEVFTKLPPEVLTIVAAFEPDIVNHTILRMRKKLEDAVEIIINKNEKIIIKMLLPEKIQELNKKIQELKLEIKQINRQIKQHDKELEIFSDEDSYINLNLNAQLSSLIDTKNYKNSQILYLCKALKISQAIIKQFIKI